MINSIVVDNLQHAAARAGGQVRRGRIGFAALDTLAVFDVFHSATPFHQ